MIVALILSNEEPYVAENKYKQLLGRDDFSQVFVCVNSFADGTTSSTKKSRELEDLQSSTSPKVICTFLP